MPSSVYEKQYPLGRKYKLELQVREGDGDEQRVKLSTDLAGKLVLHWGVEGGQDYRGGWRLPDESCRPEGTVMYKNRALQTPWRQGGLGQEVEIVFSGDECSDFLNFVVKDASSETWYDFYGGNFHVPLRLALSSMALDEASMDEEAGLPDDSLPELPGELTGIWAYIKWEADGCPNRSQQDSDAEFQRGILEIRDALRSGVSLDEIWKVARGEVKYADFMQQRRGKARRPPVQEAPESPPAKETPKVPEELVGIQAYILWERAGKPDGADFSNDARGALQDQLDKGATIEHLEKSLKAPSPVQPEPMPEAPAEQEEEAPQPPPPQPAQQEDESQLGDTIGASRRNPLELIKGKAPLLSDEKRQAPARPLSSLETAAANDSTCLWQRTYNLSNKGELLATVTAPEGADGPKSITLTTDQASDLVLHWGVRAGKQEWVLPPANVRPADAEQAGDIALETPFSHDGEAMDVGGDALRLQRLRLSIPPGAGVTGLTFVMRSADGSAWFRDGGSNFRVPIPGKQSEAADDPSASIDDELTRSIVEAENSDQWTLMHRFNRAAELLDQALRGEPEEVVKNAATLYAWLRYSSARKLTWQRNYNTQPRILGEAQQRLTHAIAQAHSKTGGEAQEWVRSMLATCGRGGNAQAVRDEILNIMHRNNIGEKRGTWMEARFRIPNSKAFDWHQKLHNNTTPDDVAICEAYIAFLESNGDKAVYWKILSDAGIDRARLESFDRAIKVEPEDYPDKRSALINDFRNYLGILKAVHSGADLNASAEAASGALPGAAKGFVGYVLSHQGDHVILPLIENAVAARAEIVPAMVGNRELLYLDLALEAVVRSAAERGSRAAGAQASPLVGPLLENLVLSTGDNEELCYCLKAWQDLPASVQAGKYPSKEDALKATAVVDRMRRAIAATSDAVSARLAAPASALGRACGVDGWYVDLFAEEVVRGGPAFAVSLVLSAIEPALRASAELGAWQLISPGDATGRVAVVSGLHEVQDEVYDEPTVLVAKRVTGEEEVPEGVVAVLTPDAPDVLSHVSVRARNMKVLFAICHDHAPLAEIEEQAGKAISVTTSAAGGVTWEAASDEALAGGDGARDEKPRRKLKISIPKWCGKWVVGMDGYADGVVGAKSKNLAGLRGKLPEEIKLPPSVTVPFSSFEEALKQPENKAIASELEGAIRGIPSAAAESKLKGVRDLVMQVKVPKELRTQLESAMEAAGIPVPESEQRWEEAFKALKGVWASKYNERALLSMKKVGLDFNDLRMAVLVQRVVPAEYAYVIHTHNPANGSPDEIYAEVVRGLGESIVSGMVPGSSLAFMARKADLSSPEVMMYPSKSDGMFVPESLIFRSDSNGEDLEGYAGAGLYDSITVDETVLRKVDYGEDRLLKDEAFRRDLLSRIAKTGAAIEEALGSAQDVEGCVSKDGDIFVVQTRPQM